MLPRKLEVGDIVQITPLKDGFGGCFMLVTEPKSWGAQGFVAVPQNLNEQPGRAYLRCSWDQMEYVGKAAWIPCDEVEGNETIEEGGENPRATD